MKYLPYAAVLAAAASPSMRREWIEMASPCLIDLIRGSPSMRREWIEMRTPQEKQCGIYVSLHAEGVD